MLFSELAALSERIAATRKRSEKIASMAQLIATLPGDERAVAVLYLAGELVQRKLGVGHAQVHALRDVPPAAEASLRVHEVNETFAAIAAEGGPGSAGRRVAALRSLFARATASEQAYLAKLIVGELRQGALQSLVLDALAKASGQDLALVRRAQMLAADLGAVAQAALDRGEEGLRSFDLVPLKPVQPMLAEPAADVEDALERLGKAAFEWKLDGARIQVHKQGDAVRVFTRSLQDVTARVPEVAELLAELPARELILDGEAIALRADGRPLPFQDTMRRFGRQLKVAEARAERALSLFFFDCLYADGESLLDAPTETRVQRLHALLPERTRVPRLVTADLAEADAFMTAALAAGHEGAMAKALDAPYAAGRRGASWLKLKLAHTLDLVVLAVEWGSGRRTGLLSNLHLGARDEENGGFAMLGKTFKGMTDELLRWQTDALLARETSRENHIVHVRPELVVEIAFSDVQTSPHYPSGLALRFARVKRYREDKTAAEADTLATVRKLHAIARD